MLSICIIAQIAIFLKKQFEHRRDRFVVANIEKQNTNNFMNNQEWNLLICTSPQTVFFVFMILVMHMFSRIIELKWLPDFNSFEKSLLVTNTYQIILFIVPLYMYGKNVSMFRHLINDILEKFIGIEIMQTKFPKLPTIISQLSVQNIKILLQKLWSKFEPILNNNSSACQIKTSNDVHTVKKISTETILKQIQEGKVNENVSGGDLIEKVNEEKSNHNYPEYLTYLDQKARLSATRIKEAGFQLSKETPDDGNCLIHALKDQMR